MRESETRSKSRPPNRKGAHHEFTRPEDDSSWNYDTYGYLPGPISAIAGGCRDTRRRYDLWCPRCEEPYCSLHEILKKIVYDVLEEVEYQPFEKEKRTAEDVIAARKLSEAEE